MDDPLDKDVLNVHWVAGFAVQTIATLAEWAQQGYEPQTIADHAREALEEIERKGLPGSIHRAVCEALAELDR